MTNWVDVMNRSRVGQYMDSIESGLIARHLPTRPLNVLDIGGGTGRWSAWLRERGHQSALLELDFANLCAAHREQPTLNAVQADALFAPFPNQAFDAIIAVQLLDVLPNKARFIGEIYRLLKPNGHLFISWTNKRSIKGLLYGRYSDLKGTPAQDRFQIYSATHEENLAYLLGAGFRVDESFGYAWSLLPRSHNSVLVDAWAALERGLRLNQRVSLSPNVLLAARKP